jgi:copper chaperone
MQALTIEIGGMSCGHCVGAVRSALERLPGVEVKDVRVGSATVAFDAAATSPERIADAIRDEGYQPKEG